MLQNGAKMVENSSRSLIFKEAVYSLKRMRKMKKKVEESDMISNIFDDVNLGNTAYEPGSQLTIIDAPAT